MFKAFSNYLMDLSKAVLLLLIILLFVFRVCLCHTVVSVLCSLVVSCWPLGFLACDIFLCLSLSQMVSWVRCGTWLYRFLIFAFFLTYACSLFSTYVYRSSDNGSCKVGWIESQASLNSWVSWADPEGDRVFAPLPPPPEKLQNIGFLSKITKQLSQHLMAGGWWSIYSSIWILYPLIN